METAPTDGDDRRGNTSCLRASVPPCLPPDASFPSGASGAGGDPAPDGSLTLDTPRPSASSIPPKNTADGRAFIPLRALVAAGHLPGQTPCAVARQAQRACVRLARVGQARQVGRAWLVAPDAELFGRPAAAWLAGPRRPTTRGHPLPPGHTHWSDADRRRFLDTCALLDAYDRWRSRAGLDPPTDFGACRAADVFPAFLRLSPSLSVSDWAAARGLRCDPRRLRDYRRRLSRDGNVDRRGRPKGDTVTTCSPEAWESFKSFWLTPQQRSVALCWELAAREARQHGWAWPTLRTIQARVRAELPPFHADYYRLGPLAWSRKHQPRIQRDLSSVRPNQTWVGDHCKFDFLALHDGKPIRPWVTAWQDQRSRMITGWQITAGPDSDTILAAFKAGVVAHGAPDHIIIDNGKDYRAKGFSGGRRGKPRLDEDRTTSVCGQLGIRITFCEPFNPGSKCIESWFDTLHERFDKLFDSYCGRAPDARPEDLYARLRKDDVELPTLAEVSAQFVQFLDAFHRRPHSGDGMQGLCPLDVFTKCDPLPKRTAPRNLLDELLKRTVQVKVSRHGVRHNKVYYGQGELALRPLHGRAVLLAIDPEHADYVDVRELNGRPICRAYQQRLRGLTQADLKEAKHRQKHARRLAQSVGSAYRTAAKSVVELALEAQAEQAGQLRQAVGAEGQLILDSGPADRPFSLLTGVADYADYDGGDEPGATEGDDAPLKLDFGAPDEDPPDGCVGDLLSQLEFDDE